MTRSRAYQEARAGAHSCGCAAATVARSMMRVPWWGSSSASDGLKSLALGLGVAFVLGACGRSDLELLPNEEPSGTEAAGTRGNGTAGLAAGGRPSAGGSFGGRAAGARAGGGNGAAASSEAGM